MRWIRAAFAALCLFANVSTASAQGMISLGASGGPTPPAQAAAAGYNTETFAVDTFTTFNVDMGATYASGYKLYFTNSRGRTPVTANTSISNGQLIVGAGLSCCNATIGLIGEKTGAPYFVGIALGGGYYVEIKAHWTPNGSPTSTSYWPAFWSDPLESMTSDQNPSAWQWQGQATGYAHWSEPDYFEYLCGINGTPCQDINTDYFDHYGQLTCTGSAQCNVNAQNPISQGASSFFTSDHTYGELIVPATGSTSGYAKFYIDGVLQHTLTWTQYNCTSSPVPPPTVSSPWLYGVMDCEHAGVILSGGNPVAVTVSYIHVWQASAAGNLTY
jgi:hypothetical protein